MASILDLRRRIRSVTNTRQITRAMKMIAAARLRRAQQRAMDARPYAQMITAVLQSLLRRIEIHDPETGEIRHPLFIVRPEKNVLLIVVSGEKGFAGGFNANIFKAAFSFIKQNADRNIDVEPVGRKARDLFRRRYPLATYVEQQSDGHHTRRQRQRNAPIEITGDHSGLLGNLNAETMFDFAHSIIKRYVHEEIDACYLVYNEFKSVLAQRVVVERLLPFYELGGHLITVAEEPAPEERERAVRAAISAGVPLRSEDTSQEDEEAKTFGTANVDYIYEEPQDSIFDALLPHYLAAMIYHALIESTAAEEAARMTAMDSATNNANEMIDSYTLAMNRARQAAITKEIIEIVSGAAAL